MIDETTQSNPLPDPDPFSELVQAFYLQNPFDEALDLYGEIRLFDETVYAVAAYEPNTNKLFHFTNLHDDWEDALRSWESCRERWEKILGLS